MEIYHRSLLTPFRSPAPLLGGPRPPRRQVVDTPGAHQGVTPTQYDASFVVDDEEEAGGTPGVGTTDAQCQARAGGQLAASSESEGEAAAGCTLEHEEQCRQCGRDGDLLLCDGCPAAVHLRCVGLWRVPKGTYDGAV